MHFLSPPGCQELFPLILELVIGQIWVELPGDQQPIVMLILKLLVHQNGHNARKAEMARKTASVIGSMMISVNKD